MLVDKNNFVSVLYNFANFYRFEETSNYWSVTRRSVFLCFSLVNQRHTSAITVYNRTVANIEILCGPCIAAIAGYVFLFASLEDDIGSCSKSIPINNGGKN